MLQEGEMSTLLDDGTVRVTASLSRSQEQALKDLAARHKVSMAWLIRHAVDQLIEQSQDAQLPLNFSKRA
jgi:predicted DNA-binding protein